MNDLADLSSDERVAWSPLLRLRSSRPRLLTGRLTGPAVQGEVDATAAIRLAHEKNDLLAEKITPHRDRLGGFAAVAMQDPQAAASELRRAVSTHGFRGALINGFTDLAGEDSGVYLDDPRNDVFWETA